MFYKDLEPKVLNKLEKKKKLVKPLGPATNTQDPQLAPTEAL